MRRSRHKWVRRTQSCFNRLVEAEGGLPCGFLTFWLKRGEPWQPPIWFKDTVDGSEIRRSPVEVRIPKPGSLKYGLYIVRRGIPWKNRLQSGFKLIEQHIFIASMSTIFYAYMQRLALCCRCRYRCCCCRGLCLMVMTMCWLCWQFFIPMIAKMLVMSWGVLGCSGIATSSPSTTSSIREQRLVCCTCLTLWNVSYVLLNVQSKGKLPVVMFQDARKPLSFLRVFSLKFTPRWINNWHFYVETSWCQMTCGNPVLCQNSSPSQLPWTAQSFYIGIIQCRTGRSWIWWTAMTVTFSTFFAISCRSVFFSIFRHIS